MGYKFDNPVVHKAIWFVNETLFHNYKVRRIHENIITIILPFYIMIPCLLEEQTLPIKMFAHPVITVTLAPK